MIWEEIKHTLDDIEILTETDDSLDLVKIGYTCGKMAYDIKELHKNLEKVLFVIPLRGGLPVWRGVAYGLSRLDKTNNGLSPELSVAYLPASSVLKERENFIKRSITDILKREYKTKEYEAIVIVDEAISGSSSKMVFDSVKKGIKDYRDERDWKRFYWQRLPVELYLLAAERGQHLNPKIQKLSNVLVYPLDGRIITTDNSSIYPLEYITEIDRRVSSSGKVYAVIEPDVLFKKNKKWNAVVREIEKGVDRYFQEQNLL